MELSLLPEDLVETCDDGYLGTSLLESSTASSTATTGDDVVVVVDKEDKSPLSSHTAPSPAQQQQKPSFPDQDSCLIVKQDVIEKGEVDKPKKHLYYQRNQKQRVNPAKIPVKVEESLEEEQVKVVERVVASQKQKSNFIQPKQPTSSSFSSSSSLLHYRNRSSGEKEKSQKHFHNKTFFLHDNNNSKGDNRNSSEERESNKEYYSGSKNHLNLNRQKYLPLAAEATTPPPTSLSSLRSHLPVKRNTLSVNNKNNSSRNNNKSSSGGISGSGCPNCCKNRLATAAAVGKPPAAVLAKKGTSLFPLSPSNSLRLWLLSMEPGEQGVSSADLHRKRDDHNNASGGGGNDATTTSIADEDDDLPRDSLDDTAQPVLDVGDDDDDEDEYEEDNVNGEEEEELTREDLIRFLLANSAGIGGGAAMQSYQFLQQQLLQHQQNCAAGGGGGGGIGPHSSMHGAVGGVGLEPIMDASFQDDFDDIHSDYQWFTESGFETDAAVGCGEPVVGVPEYPVSLLGEASHHHGSHTDFDATMAQIDIEDFHSEDILLRLPPLCASDLQQGETIASITGSILQHLEFEDSMTPNSHSVEDDQNAQSMDMSICKSENLFSPMNENQEALPLSTFSTDSLDTRAGEILATCMTNRNNYTIAFQGMEESNTSSTYKTAPGEGVSTPSSVDLMENDGGMMTNWRQVTSNNSTGSQRGSVDNNNGSNESSTGGGSGTPNNNTSQTSRTNSWSTSTTTRRSLMTQSCPHPPRNNNTAAMMCMITANNLGLLRTNPGAAIKLFDIQNVQTVQLAQIYQRHVAQRHNNRQQLGSGSSMTDSGTLLNNANNNSTNNNNPPMMMTSGSAGSSLSSGRHNTPQILEESWNNNRNPIPPTTPTHYHHHPTHHPHHHHHYGKYGRSRKHHHSSSTSSSSSTTPQTTTQQLADAVRKLRSIEIQTSITLVTPPHHHHHHSRQLYSANPSETINECSNASIPQLHRNMSSCSSQVSQTGSHQQQQSQQQPPPVYICYPSYTLPDLRFLEQHRPKNPVILMPQRYKTSSGKGAHHRTQTSMQCPGSNGVGGYGGGGGSSPYNNIPKGRRPLSCNDIEELRSRDLSHVRDWPSLNFLLPKEYQQLLAEIKPPEKREQRDDSEKETADIKEESCSQLNATTSAAPCSAASNNHVKTSNNVAEDPVGGSSAAAAAMAGAGESPVILRRRINGGAGGGRAHPTKRYSMNDAAGFLGQQQQLLLQQQQQQAGGGIGLTTNRNRNGLAEKFKRFSLQETLPEVAEITSEIAKNLEQLESLALTATTGSQSQGAGSGTNHHHHQQQQQQHYCDDTIEESLHNNLTPLGNDNNIPSFSGGISSSEESTTSTSNLHPHHHKRVPANTPKQTSFVDFDNHFQLRNHAFFDDGGAAAAARIIAHVAPMCPGNGATKGASHLQKTPIDMALKQSLTDAVAASVNQIQSVWETTQAVKNVTGSRDSVTAGPNSCTSSGGGGGAAVDNKNRLTPTSETASTGVLTSPHKSLYQSIMSQTPAGKVVLDSLCPALYSLLSDGLCPFLDTIFGRVPNTVWRVVEASIQYGPTAQSLNELVLRINSEELLAEGPMKFNAFVCGLLNLRNLGSWLTFLRTKERLLRTHYEQDAFMYLCNTTTRFLYDQMLVNMHLLSKSPFPAFQLDIFHETKLLHQSMNPVTPTKSLPASLPVSRKNSVKGSSRYNAGSGGTGGSSASSTPRKSTSADARPAKTQSKNSKYHANQLKKSQMKRSFSDERPKTSRVAPSTIPKSKTAQNITHDRSNLHHHPPGAGGPTSTLNTRLLSRFPSKPKLSNYSRGSSGGASGGGAAGSSDHHHHHHGSAGSVDDEGREKGMSEPTKAQRPKSFDGSHLTNVAAGGGLLHKGLSPDSNKDSERFRRLQMQWELLSSDESRKGSPGHSHTSSSNTSNTTAPSLAGSKIPRPINSPTRANITTHLGNVRPSTGNNKR